VLAALLVLALGSMSCMLRAEPAAEVVRTPPPQAAPSFDRTRSGYSHSLVTKAGFGSDGQAYYVFTPDGPRPRSAPVILFLHGYRATDPYVYGGWIDHLVRRGNIVIYPVFEAGRFDSAEEMLANLASATRSALATLSRSGPVSPDTSKFAVVGHSVGGGLTVEVAARAAQLGLPQPRAIMPVQPGSKKNPVREETIRQIPPSVLMLVIDGDSDQFKDSRDGPRIFGDATQLPASHRAYVLLQSDAHGGARLLADHYAPLSPREDYRMENLSRRQERRKEFVKALISARDGETDALDYNGFWKLFDALTAVAFSGGKSITNVLDAAGGADMGAWSDGRPVARKLITIN